MSEDPERAATRVAAAALAHPWVAGLHPGRFGEVATYLPGDRIAGVRIHPDAVEVHVVGYVDVPAPELADAVRTAVSAVAGGRRVDIVVADLIDRVDPSPLEPLPATPPPGSPR